MQRGALTLLALSLAHVALGHEHNDTEIDSPDNLLKPIDSILWLHIVVQILTWGFVFPIGMVLGLARLVERCPSTVSPL